MNAIISSCFVVLTITFKQCRNIFFEIELTQLLEALEKKTYFEAIILTCTSLVNEAFQTKKRGNLGPGPNRGRGVLNKS